MNKIIKPFTSILFLSIVAFFIKVATTPKTDIAPLKQMRAQTAEIIRSEKVMMNIIANNTDSDKSFSKNIGNEILDKNYAKIFNLTSNQSVLKNNIQKQKFAIALHFLIFEYAWTTSLSEFCSKENVDTSVYLTLFYDINKQTKSIAKEYMMAHGFMESLKTSFFEMINDPEVKQSIIDYNMSFFNKIYSESGKDIAGTCQILPMINIIYKEDILNDLNYSKTYEKNQSILFK